MSYLMSAETAAKIEAAGNDLGDVCLMLCAHRRGDRVRGFREAKWSAQAAMRANKAIRGIQSLVMFPDDRVALVKFGPRGGFTVVASIWDRKGRPV